MTQEEKELLFKDLCARLPYHVRVKVWLEDGDTEEGPLDLQHNYGDVLLDAFYYNKITKIKPYLRPMSSMTEEEAKDYFKNSEYESSECYEAGANYEPVTVKAACSADEACVNTDWLNAHHFDYRGLIPMGLALPAPEGMYEN